MKIDRIATANLGFPRIGPRRELKSALEKFWAGEWSEAQLEAAAREVRRARWQVQSDAGIAGIPSNDFSLYDHVLDTAVMTGAIPARYTGPQFPDRLGAYFAMARGNEKAAAMEMTKWFDTNYHYLVPEFEAGMEFHLADGKPIEEYLEAKALGFDTRPVLLGPVSFAMLGKIRAASLSEASVAEALVEVYGDLMRELASAGATWVQMDEPCLGLDLPPAMRHVFGRVYEQLAAAGAGISILLATYFSGLADNLEAALHLPIGGLHMDLVRAPGQLPIALKMAPAGLRLSLGVIDGRNVWRAGLHRALAIIREALDRVGPGRVEIAPSCSLMHIPIDLEPETQLDPELRTWMAFARQKLEEIALLARAAAGDNSPEIAEQFAANQRILSARSASARACDPAVRSRTAAITPHMRRRSSAFAERRKHQVRLPVLPTTTIGSFPQTPEIRRARAARRSGKLSRVDYETMLRAEIERAIRFQEEIGLDVLVHGEFERNDMVEHFGEQLNGFAFTGGGWVQSYGSRCVKPPIIFGDVSRPKPITVDWIRYAQSLTTRPVKGMITGPVTMIEWSFVRDDLPRRDVCFQVALALRDEVDDLQSAGIDVVQVDEPALREGLPLRASERPAYLEWAVDAFLLATAVARNAVQIHTHMCYAEFGEVLDAIIRMDADVISMEAARSNMEILETFAARAYPNGIGPGVYDIHSPRVPGVEEMETRIRRASGVFRMDQLWVNPDCGLKTRQWEEVRPALRNMVIAAQRVREAELRERGAGPAGSFGGRK